MNYQWWLPLCLCTSALQAMEVLEPTLVIGTPTQINEVDLAKSSANVIVIERTQFADKQTDLAQVLRQYAGLQINQSAAIGSYSTVSIRGASHQQLQIYLDGVPLNSSQGSGVDISQINLQSIERIDVYPAVTPIEFAQSNLAGIIHLHSRQGQSQVELSQTIGSFNASQTQALARVSQGAHQGLFAFSTQRSDNDFRFENNNQTPLNPHDDFTDKMPYNQFKQNNALVKYGYNASTKWQSDFLLQRTVSQQQLPPALHLNTQTGADLDTETWQFNGVLNGHQLAHGFLDWQPSLFFTQKNQHFSDEQSRVGLLVNNNQMRLDTLGTNQLVQLNWHSDLVHKLNLSLTQQTYQNIDLQKSNQHNVDILRFDLATGVQWTPSDWTLSAQWRFTQERQDAEEEQSQDFQALQLGVTYPITAQWQLKANLGQYYRLPTVEEYFGDRGYSMGNPDVRPEKSINSDAGLHYWQGDWKMDFTLFARDVDDYIYQHYNSQGISQARNLERIQITGIESQFSWQMLDWLSHQIQFTLQDSTYHSAYAEFDGKQTPLLYHQSGQYQLRVQVQAWSAQLNYQLQDDRYYDTANLVKSPRRETLDMELKWQGEHWSTTLQGNNLTDSLNRSDQGDFYNYPLPSRAYYFTVSYHY